MGKNLTQQKRGKGSPTYKAPTFRAKGDTKLLNKQEATILDLIKSAFSTAPLAVLQYPDQTTSLVPAVEGMAVGDNIAIGKEAPLANANALPLELIPEGASICCIEARPGDGGKFMKASGASAKVMAKTSKGVVVQFKSKKTKTFNPQCLALLGVVAGGGRVDKPFLKAGNKYKAMKAKNKYYPSVSAASMNAVDHPLGGKRSSRKGRPTIAPANAPPGRKVGMIRPRFTGRARGKRKK